MGRWLISACMLTPGGPPCGPNLFWVLWALCVLCVVYDRAKICGWAIEFHWGGGHWGHKVWHDWLLVNPRLDCKPPQLKCVFTIPVNYCAPKIVSLLQMSDHLTCFKLKSWIVHMRTEPICCHREVQSTSWQTFSAKDQAINMLVWGGEMENDSVVFIQLCCNGETAYAIYKRMSMPSYQSGFI
jgi:hypothetical protein